MIDSLDITDLIVRTRIGVGEKEREKPQRILLSLRLAVDAQTIAKTDDPSESLDYGALIDDIRVLAQTERRTIERLAEDVAALTLQSPAVFSVTVTVRKSPPLEDVKEVSVTITRSREADYKRGPLIA